MPISVEQVQATLIDHATTVFARVTGQKPLPKLVANVVNGAVLRLFNRGTVDVEAAKLEFEELIAAAERLAAERTPPVMTAEDVLKARPGLPPASLYA